MKRLINIVHLYPREMNIYGDTGNRLILKKRLEWRDFEVKISLVGTGETIPDDADIIIGGGGQDAGQSVVQDDLQQKAAQLRNFSDRGVVMLMVCGLYQLFGKRFVTHENEEIKGIGIFPMETIAGPTRLIGNTVYDSKWGEIVGYENHSGLTRFDDVDLAIATVKQGAGNNGEDATEGCRVNNVFGTYSHGPVLAKNPKFTDMLLQLAVDQKYGEARLESLESKLEQRAADIAKTRPR